MANNRVQVKRTSTAGRTPNTTGSYATNSQFISAGELALNMADGILYSSNGSSVIEIGANNTNVNSNGNISLTVNAKRLNFTPLAGGSNVYFTQQNDDNFVFYSTNTLNQSRAIWSVFGNSATSAFALSVPITLGGNLTLGSFAVSANGGVGTSGQVLTSNGSATYWATAGAASSLLDTQDTAPGGPSDGKLYWNSALGKLLIYYSDANTSQWVEATPTGAPGPTGPQGATGYDGSIGGIGYTGSIGGIGYTGSIGAIGYTGSVGPFSPKSITIPNPVAGDTFTILWTNSALTVAEIKTLVRGTSPTVNATISWGADRSTASNTIITNYTTSNVTNGNTATSFTNATPIANSYVWVTINSTTGTVTEYHATLRFT